MKNIFGIFSLSTLACFTSFAQELEVKNSRHEIGVQTQYLDPNLTGSFHYTYLIGEKRKLGVYTELGGSYYDSSHLHVTSSRLNLGTFYYLGKTNKGLKVAINCTRRSHSIESTMTYHDDEKSSNWNLNPAIAYTFLIKDHFIIEPNIGLNTEIASSEINGPSYHPYSIGLRVKYRI